MLLKKNLLFLALATFGAFSGCNLAKKAGDINFFTIQDDLALGKEFSQQIESDKAQFPILKEQGNEEAYKYVRGITQKLLNSGKVAHANEFAWQVKIIDDDKTLNAFAVPGGYLYVYTGLIKYLDTEDELAGVMGHEIAHAALRHSTQQMTKIYGLDALRQIATGKKDPGVLAQLALGLVSLKFSRSHESEADEHSVTYLCGTNYRADGAAGFFRKIKGKGGTPPEFLSTHPDPGNRIKNIESSAQALACAGKGAKKTEHEKVKKLLK